MAADAYVQLEADGAGKRIDTSELTVSGQTVERQRLVLADPLTAAGLASVSATKGLAVFQPISTTSTVTAVASSETSVTLKASNSSRLGLAIQNDSSSVLYVKLGAVASSTDYTVKLFSQSYYEVPFNYTGIVDGIWVTATGNALVTEVT